MQQMRRRMIQCRGTAQLGIHRRAQRHALAQRRRIRRDFADVCVRAARAALLSILDEKMHRRA
jgi:hypothetical protein